MGASAQGRSRPLVRAQVLFYATGRWAALDTPMKADATGQGHLTASDSVFGSTSIFLAVFLQIASAATRHRIASLSARALSPSTTGRTNRSAGGSMCQVAMQPRRANRQHDEGKRRTRDRVRPVCAVFRWRGLAVITSSINQPMVLRYAQQEPTQIQAQTFARIDEKFCTHQPKSNADKNIHQLHQ